MKDHQVATRRTRRKAGQPPPESSATTGTHAMVRPLSSEARRDMIRDRAYFLAEKRGFSPGFAVDDWLAAEAEVDALLAQSPN